MIGIWQVQRNMLSDCASRSLNSQLVAAPQSGAYSIRSNRGASENLHVSFALFSVQTHLAPARPNQPINRTYCGRRRLGFRFTLAQTPPAAIGRLSATLGLTITASCRPSPTPKPRENDSFKLGVCRLRLACGQLTQMSTVTTCCCRS